MNVQKTEKKPIKITKPAPIVGSSRILRNGPCPCQSGKKYKKCCMHEVEKVLQEN